MELKIKGRIIRRTEPGFDKAVRGTLFNQRETGRKPLLMVQPQTVQDVIAVVRYAASTGKKISVSSGGHSWSANHIRNDGILLDMAHFNEYTIDKEQRRAQAGPGVSGSDLLTELFKQDLFFPAGHCKGVCLGGYLLQGGFAWNGRKLGLACESVVGLDVVTADGDYVHASATENADLYWAARGSGGGFCGVVVRFHLKLYRRPAYSGIIMHAFSLKYLEDVFSWAAAAGPAVPPAIELQLLMSRKTLKFFVPGIEVAAPIFADTADELQEAAAFMEHSPIKSKAYGRTPFIKTGVKLLYRFAMTHYPARHCWGVDNMWTNAAINELLPYLKGIAETLPPPPSHVLWLNWQPPARAAEMAFSLEDNIYLALYGGWKAAGETALYGSWATDWMRKMSHLASGIQLADENLNHRTAPFMAPANMQKLADIRSARDPGNIFNEWHSKPQIG